MSTKQKQIATTPQLGQRRYNEPRPARIAAQAQPVKARKRNRYRARRIPWLTISLLVIGVAFVGALVASGALQAAPRGTIAATGATSYDFGTVPMKGGDITTRFPITVQGDARAIDITST